MPQPVVELSQSIPFDRTTPLIALLTGSHGDLIRDIHIVVTDGFNDPAATISVGTDIDRNEVVPAADVLAQVAGEYAHTKTYRLDTGRYVYLYIDAMGSTSGAGVLSWVTAKGLR